MHYPVAVFSVIFPANLRYFNDFIESVNVQTATRFELVLANDGVENIDTFLTELRVPCTVLPCEGTPAAIRSAALVFLAKQGYQYVIFADTDDTMSNNRVEVSCGYLEDYPIVCNDLMITDCLGKIIDNAYWTSRLKDDFIFDAVFLKDKNIVGLGNSAVRASILKSVTTLPAELVAPDWFLFYLLLQQHEAVFTTKSQTHYRQHEANTIGLKRVTEQSLKNVIRAKSLHYTYLRRAGYDLNDEEHKLQTLSYSIADAHTMAGYLDLLNNNPVNYFWWEETNYLI